MNREAQRLGLANTHFVNATGLPDPQHYSTARDLSLLARAIIRDIPTFDVEVGTSAGQVAVRIVDAVSVDTTPV